VECDLGRVEYCERSGSEVVGVIGWKSHTGDNVVLKLLAMIGNGSSLGDNCSSWPGWKAYEDG